MRMPVDFFFDILYFECDENSRFTDRSDRDSKDPEDEKERNNNLNRNELESSRSLK